MNESRRSVGHGDIGKHAFSPRRAAQLRLRHGDLDQCKRRLAAHQRTEQALNHTPHAVEIVGLDVQAWAILPRGSKSTRKIGPFDTKGAPFLVLADIAADSS
jgi:hypothetical protein